MPGYFIFMRQHCRRWLVVVCTAFALVAVVARFAFLHISYEYDEVFTAITANTSLSLGWIWRNWLLPDVHPPLHNIFLYFYNHFVPYGPEIWLRLPSVAFSLGALACAWFMFPKRWGKIARLVFFSLLSCQLYGVFYSQHARAYSLVLLLAIPLTFLFLNMSRAVYKRKSITAKQWICFGILSLLLSWTHYFGALAFGLFSILLFVQGWKYKQRLLWFIVVPCLVFICFLPWLVPNLLECISQGRFSGNWWANEIPFNMTLPGLVDFFFSTDYLYFTMLIMLSFSLVLGYRHYRKDKKFAYMREIGLLLAVLLLAFGTALLFLFKMYLLLGRYFFAFVPSMFLLCTLIITPLLRRSTIFLALFVIYVGMSLGNLYISAVSRIWHPMFLPYKPAMQYYLQNYPNKDLLVIAMEAFPLASLESMYSFYPNQIYKQNKRVRELMYLSEAEREKELENRDKSAIWMPNCRLDKLQYIAKEWDRVVAVEEFVASTCFLRLSDKGVKEAPKEWDAIKLSEVDIW